MYEPMTTHKRIPPRSTVIFDQVKNYSPITRNQEIATEAWAAGKHLILSGSPGTGKTFLGMYFGLRAVLLKGAGQDKLVVVRSIVPTRDIGFLPGDEKEKKEAYMKPYIGISAELTGDPGAWGKLLATKACQFESTSFARGITIDNAVILVDEMQNLTFHELDTVMGRVGENCRVIFCGDYHQSDLHRDSERQGLLKFLEIVSLMKDFEVVKFGWEDIVRSDFVRDYIMTKEMLERKNAQR
jgi:predicted ribonuclease YlaK